MYTRKDEQAAKRRCRRFAFVLLAVLAPLLAVYIAGVLMDHQWLMLASLLAGFICAMIICDLCLLPALRYARFLRDMSCGLRRSAECTLESLDEDAQMQDGVRVRALHVRLCAGGDSRIFYMNLSKIESLPPVGTTVKLTAYGRHVVECEVL